VEQKFSLGWRDRVAAGVKAFVTPGPRMVDELECVASVLLAILLGHLAGARNVSWAAFSGYMVMRGQVTESLRRGLFRVIGTGCGALLALACVDTVGAGLVPATLALAAVGGLTLFAALTSKRSYAWLFVGLTFSMILLDQIDHPAETAGHFAVTRVVEVVAGTAACVLVSMLSAISLRRRWPAPKNEPPRSTGWRPDAARHAGQGAFALALLPLLHLVLPLHQLSQAAVAIMAVMLVPVGGIGASGLRPVSRRIVMRVAGCAAGASFAAAMLLASQGAAAALVLGAAIGVMLGRHIENAQSNVAYAGTQFVLAVLVTLVPDSYANPDLHAGCERLAGTLLGIAVLLPVLIAWHVMAPRLRADGGENRSELGDI